MDTNWTLERNCSGPVNLPPERIIFGNSSAMRALRQTYERAIPPFSKEMRQSLENCEWRGNIRELENRIAHYVLLGSDDGYETKVTGHSRHAAVTRFGGDASLPLKHRMKDAIRQMKR
jgi:DNA-binding NtrC family response regulator